MSKYSFIKFLEAKNRFKSLFFYKWALVLRRHKTWRRKIVQNKNLIALDVENRFSLKEVTCFDSKLCFLMISSALMIKMCTYLQNFTNERFENTLPGEER